MSKEKKEALVESEMIEAAFNFPELYSYCAQI